VTKRRLTFNIDDLTFRNLVK